MALCRAFSEIFNVEKFRDLAILSRTACEINGDFSRKSQNFLTRVFCAPADVVPVELDVGAWSQKARMMMALLDGAKVLR